MYKIIEKKLIAENEYLMKIIAPRIAKKRKAGQFIILIPSKGDERIPLTIVDSSVDEGWIEIIFQVVGATTYKLSLKEVGDELYSFVGPLGKPTHIDNWGTTIMVGGGVGIAPLYPITKAVKEAGNRVITILGARTKNLLILEDRMKSISDRFLIYTDDGSYGEKGLVTDAIKKLVEEGEDIKQVIAIGPAIMMKFVSLLTKEYNFPTLVSLNTIMVDGTGMCGSCRISVGGQTKFVCVDGPEFDAHQVDWENMLKRATVYKEQEKIAYEKLLKEYQKGN
jgi:ferredoxin--NADP+ reductase